MKREEGKVTNIVNTIEAMVDPFTCERSDLINISSGTVAPIEVMNDLLQGHSVGKTAAEKFTEERISANGSVDFFTPIKLNKLKTFAAIGKKTTRAVGSKNVTLQLNDKLFTRLLIIGKTRDIDLRRLLSYALTTVPASLGTSDGQLVKTAKAKLMHEVEQLDPLVDRTEIPHNSALMIDGMALIQIITTVPSSFAELAKLIFDNMIMLGKSLHCSRIDFVVDRYPLISIKNCERAWRAETGVQIVQIPRPDQKTPKQFKKFLSNGQNKEQLIEFLFSSWKCVVPECFYGIEIFLCHQEFCHSLRVVDNEVVVEEIHELECDHEEADTRMILHAKHASTNYSNILIRSPDTDVMLLSIPLAHEVVGSVYFVTGTGSCSRISNVSSLANKLGTTLSNALLGLHVFTGCDSVSAFRGKGKVKAFKFMLEMPNFCETFETLGNSWNMCDEMVDSFEKFVCILYGQKNCSTVNDARYNIFRLKCSNDAGLPPNRDCLKQHILRANYQCAIYRRACQRAISAPSTDGHGWRMENGTLVVNWMTEAPAPDNVLQDVHCRCKKSKCNNKSCSCKSAQLPCTDLCGCLDCENNDNISTNNTSSDESEEDDAVDAF